MSTMIHDALSIFAAAHDAGNALALRVGDRCYTFAELAALTQERLRTLDCGAPHGIPYPLTATNRLETLVTLCALLERRVPALLLDPRLTSLERSALLHTAARAGRVPHADAAAILFTSGTTGHPRGAVLTRGSLVASAAASAANLGWQDDDCWLLCVPVARIGGLSIVTRCLAARRALALAGEFDAMLLPAWIAEHRVTLASMVPTMLTRLLDAHPDWRPPHHLRAILLGGAPASPALLRRAQDRGLPIVITYGLTETCSQVAATPYDARYAPAAECAGTPLSGAAIRIVDGHIHVSGPMLMAGYWDGPALPAGAWLDTGDLGEVDARGCLSIHARRVDLIVTGGENVYPAEVERVLEAFPGVAAAGVFGVPHETWGQTVAAALVTEPKPRTDALADYISGRLAPHKRPRAVCFVPRLPLTNAGKLDRRALPGLGTALQPLHLLPKS
jgi:O-succinylbenzoic acid--CoA ligase